MSSTGLDGRPCGANGETHRQCRLRMLAASLRRAEKRAEEAGVVNSVDVANIAAHIEFEFDAAVLARVVAYNQNLADRSAEGRECWDRSAEGRPPVGTGLRRVTVATDYAEAFAAAEIVVAEHTNRVRFRCHNWSSVTGVRCSMERGHAGDEHVNFTVTGPGERWPVLTGHGGSGAR